MPRAHRAIPKDNTLVTPRYAPTIGGRVYYEYGLYRTKAEALSAGSTAALFKPGNPEVGAEHVWITRARQ